MDSNAATGNFETITDEVVLFAQDGRRVRVKQGNMLLLGRGKHVMAGGEMAILHLLLEQREINDPGESKFLLVCIT